ncbi:gustatory receptor for sugar taste 43a-like [Toxorhynchites rutilus septentrionalis]|uniref:gustatory receptor for sugar taste 43a-like n=1 Tax=Toxorhynchites rutilus septentrionalis TaxID=329112 RepID=UPI00247A42FC|nr:gustatory receptor for sugar taste 43a-like [Toxorhynchites rutilus septentrionalis]
MRWFVISNIYDSIGPLAFMLNVLGLRCDSWNSSTSVGKLPVVTVYILAFITLHTGIVFGIIYIQKLHEIYQSWIVGGLEIVHATMIYAMVIYCLVFGHLASNKTRRLLACLCEIDSALSKYRIRIDHQSFHDRLIATICGVTLTSMAIVAFSFWYWKRHVSGFTMEYSGTISFYLAVYCYLLVFVQTIAMVILCMMRFVAINGVFRNMVNRPNQRIELDAFHQITFVLKVLGLHPVVTSTKKRHRLLYKTINGTVLLLSTMVYGYMLLHYALLSEIIKLNTGSVIIQRMLDIFHVLRYIMAVAVPVFALLNMDKRQRMLQRIDETSGPIAELGSGFQAIQCFKCVRCIQWTSLLTPFTCVIAVFALIEWKTLGIHVGIFPRITMAVYFVTYVQLWLQPTVLLLLLRRSFMTLGRVMRMYFPTTPTAGGFLTANVETVVCSEKEQLAVLKQIKILHDKLNDVVELVNYCFSVQITFCVGLCFVIGVVCSFGLFRAFIYRNELFYMGVLNFIWYMYYLFFVLFFIAVGSKITREGKRIGVLVHKAINFSTSTAVINELNIFSQQLLHRSPVITCGLFVYDWTLLYTMIGATATYLIILIQFDVSFPNLVNVNGTATVSTGT